MKFKKILSLCILSIFLIQPLLSKDKKKMPITFGMYSSFNTWHPHSTTLRKIFIKDFNDTFVNDINTKMYRIFDWGCSIAAERSYKKIIYFAQLNYDNNTVAVNALGFYKSGQLQRRMNLNYISISGGIKKNVKIFRQELSVGLGISYNQQILAASSNEKSVLNFIPGNGQLKDERRNEVFIPSYRFNRFSKTIKEGPSNAIGFNILLSKTIQTFKNNNQLKFNLNIKNTFGNMFSYRWYFINKDNQSNQYFQSFIAARQHNRLSFETGLSYYLQ